MSPSLTNPRVTTLLEHLRLNGLLARAVAESNSQDYIRALHDIRRVCDSAIAQHSFRVLDIAEEVEDDEL